MKDDRPERGGYTCSRKRLTRGRKAKRGTRGRDGKREGNKEAERVPEHERVKGEITEENRMITNKDGIKTVFDTVNSRREVLKERAEQDERRRTKKRLDKVDVNE